MEKHMKLEMNEQEIRDVIDRIVKRTMKMDLTWDWPCGVAYYGIADAYEKTGNEEYLKLLKDRIDELIDLGLPKVWTVNACAMGHCLISLYKATGEQKYWDIVMSKIEYLRKDALRFGENVLQHTVSANNDFPEQCWADTLFMAAFLMLRVGVELKDEDIINDALNQWYWHIKFLQDPETGLYTAETGGGLRPWNKMTSSKKRRFFSRKNRFFMPGRRLFPKSEQNIECDRCKKRYYVV